MLELLFPKETIALPLGCSPSIVRAALERRTTVTGLRGHLRDRITGRIGPEEIRLRRAHPLGPSNYWCEFRGRISSDGQRLEGSFGASGWARTFIVVWLATILGLFVPTQITQTAREGWTPNNVQLAILLPVLLGVGLLMPRIAWWGSRADRHRIKALLSEATEPAAA